MVCSLLITLEAESDNHSKQEAGAASTLKPKNKAPGGFPPRVLDGAMCKHSLCTSRLLLIFVSFGL
jgi:hypothetical protein